MQNAAGPAFLADCPTRLAVEIISDKWAVLVIFGLSHQPRRHGELVDLIGGISRKVLTQHRRLPGGGGRLPAVRRSAGELGRGD
jgi:DNA-binding HxlR family transcriptional regulator